jgi:hypothetical protein
MLDPHHKHRPSQAPIYPEDSACTGGTDIALHGARRHDVGPSGGDGSPHAQGRGAAPRARDRRGGVKLIICSPSTSCAAAMRWLDGVSRLNRSFHSLTIGAGSGSAGACCPKPRVCGFRRNLHTLQSARHLPFMLIGEKIIYIRIVGFPRWSVEGALQEAGLGASAGREGQGDGNCGAAPGMPMPAKPETPA